MNNKVLWIILAIVIGVPTLLGAGCVACVAVLGVVGSQQPKTGYSSSSGYSSGTSSGTSSTTTTTVSSGVTMANYNKLRDGITYAQAVAILGKEGTEISSNNIAGIKTVMYEWKGDGWGTNMNAMFQDGKLISKAQFGLE